MKILPISSSLDDAKDKEGLALWNNATARLKEDEREDLVRYEGCKKPYFGRIDFRDPHEYVLCSNVLSCVFPVEYNTR